MAIRTLGFPVGRERPMSNEAEEHSKKATSANQAAKAAKPPELA